MPRLLDDSGTWVLQPDIDLTNLGLNVVDLTDGTWNHLDVNSQIKTTAFEDEAVKVNTNVINVGSVNQVGTTSYNGARWFKLLKDDNGDQIKQTDTFLLVVAQNPQSASAPPPFGFAVGFSIHPYATGSTSQTNQYFVAGAVYNDGVGNSGNVNDYTHQALASGGTQGSTQLTTGSVVTHVISNGNNQGIISSVASSANNATPRCQKAYGAATGSVDLYIQVGLHTRYATTSALDASLIKQKIGYKVIKIKI